MGDTAYKTKFRLRNTAHNIVHNLHGITMDEDKYISTYIDVLLLLLLHYIKQPLTPQNHRCTAIRAPNITRTYKVMDPYKQGKYIEYNPQFSSLTGT